MAQVDEAGGKQDGFRAQVGQVVRSRRAAQWYRVLARAALVQLATFLVGLFTIDGIATIRHARPFAESSNAATDLAGLLSVLGLVAGVLYYGRTMSDPEASVLPRKQWKRKHGTLDK